MSEARFQLAYDGEAVQDGSMDVRDLGPALLAIGDMVNEANAILNGERAAASVRVESDFKKSSFEISLLLNQSLIEQAKELFKHTVVDADTLVKVLFGGTSVAVITGMIRIWKALKGEKPKQVTTINNVTIIQTGSGQILNNVDRTSAELYQSDSIRDSVRRVVEPLAKPGVEVMVIRRATEEIERISKSDAMLAFDFQETEGRPGEPLVNTRPAMLRVTRISFIEGQKWRFSDGAATFAATINDNDFLKRLDAREEGFYKGDVLRVLLKTIQQPTPDGDFKSEYSIEKVLDHLASMKQPKFPQMEN